jgi:hypothetical protein
MVFVMIIVRIVIRALLLRTSRYTFHTRFVVIVIIIIIIMLNAITRSLIIKRGKPRIALVWRFIFQLFTPRISNRHSFTIFIVLVLFNVHGPP